MTFGDFLSVIALFNFFYIDSTLCPLIASLAYFFFRSKFSPWQAEFRSGKMNRVWQVDPSARQENGGLCQIFELMSSY